MDDGSLSWIIILVLYVFMAYFAVAETAFASVNKIKIRAAQERGDSRADKAMLVLEDFDRAVTTVLIGTNITHLAVASLVTVIVTREFGMSWVAVGTIITTFDVWSANLPFIEIYGSEGTLFVPDPNNFSGSIQLYRPEEGVTKEIPMMYGYPENSRGLGLADMAKALLTGRPARCDVQQTYHVLEIIEGFETSAKTGAWTQIESVYERAPAMVRPKLKGILD